MKLDIPYYSQFKDAALRREDACGIAALKMVLDFYKPTNISIDELFKQGLEIGGYKDPDGWYHHSLVNLAQKLGYKGITRSWNIPAEYIEKLKTRGFENKDLKIMENQQLEEGLFTLKTEIKNNHPAIVSVPNNFELGRGGHLVVLTGFDKEGFYANDPDDRQKPGKDVKVDYKTFKQVWPKRAIFIHC